MKKNQETGKVTVTSGKFRGRVLKTPGGGIHPMGSREKIALFNMINDYLPGAFVLDAYAGSGALGIEALSRGAALVLFLDNDWRAIDAINTNIHKLGLTMQGGALFKDTMKEAKRATDRFSIVIADPPYESYNPKMIKMPARLTAVGGILVASTPEEPPKIRHMEIIKSKQYARAYITVYRRVK